MEQRNYRVESRVIREEGEPAKLAGYAAVFDVPSEDMGYREYIRAGAFEDSLDGDIRSLFNHDSNYVLGRTLNGTLSLKEDEHGLRFVVIPPETSWARDLLVSIERGDIDQMSFGFRVLEDRWTNQEDGTEMRELLKVELFEVSPVTFPAYPQTSVSVREIVDGISTELKSYLNPETQGQDGGCEDEVVQGFDPTSLIAEIDRKLIDLKLNERK